MIEEQIRNLIAYAISARSFSYSPYSHFAVGAALQAVNGTIFCGCNIENSAFTPTVCAERVALFNAVSQGETQFEAIAIVGGNQENVTEYCSPCGVCRQTLKEFCDEDFIVILAIDEDNYQIFTLGELLPFSFEQSDF